MDSVNSHVTLLFAPILPKTSATRGARSYRRSAGPRRAVQEWRRPSPALSKRSEGEGDTGRHGDSDDRPEVRPASCLVLGIPDPASQFLPISPSNPSLPPRESPGTSSAPRAMSRTTSPTSTRPPWRTSPATSWCCTTWRRRRRGSSRARRTPRPSPPSPSASARATWPSRNARRGVSSPCTISPPRRARPGSACSRPPTSGPRCASETRKNHPDRPN